MTKTINETAKTTGAKRLKMRIGQTTYRVGVHFNKASRETLDDKIIRLVSNESLQRMVSSKK